MSSFKTYTETEPSFNKMASKDEWVCSFIEAETALLKSHDRYLHSRGRVSPMIWLQVWEWSQEDKRAACHKPTRLMNQGNLTQWYAEAVSAPNEHVCADHSSTGLMIEDANAAAVVNRAPLFGRSTNSVTQVREDSEVLARKT
eukprot:2107262-Amphidinium_carterae.1